MFLELLRRFVAGDPLTTRERLDIALVLLELLRARLDPPAHEQREEHA